MKRISSAEFVRSFGHHTDAAMTEPTLITRNGRGRLVILSVDTYRELLALAVKDEVATGEAVRKRLRDQLEAVL
jgi:PHD/YefM family antitoxin component YafN of YafNO toxin-antitoxin module